MGTTVEKHYCYDHPSAYNNNHDALAIAAMSRNNDGSYLAQSQWMNNPFAYMMMMAWARMFGGNGWGDGNGQNAQNIELQNQIQSLRTQLSESQNTQLLRESIGDGFTRNDFALSQLAQNLNVDFNSLKDCCCQVQAAIQGVAGQVGFSAERVINAANVGDMNIISALKDCCCQNKELVQRMGYENQLGQKDIQNTTQHGFCDLGYKLQGGLDFVNRSIERGFSALGYEMQRLNCEQKTNQDANTQRIIDTLNTHWKEELAGKLQKAEFENSQLKQNQYIANLINGGCQCGGNQ